MLGRISIGVESRCKPKATDAPVAGGDGGSAGAVDELVVLRTAERDGSDADNNHRNEWG